MIRKIMKKNKLEYFILMPFLGLLLLIALVLTFTFVGLLIERNIMMLFVFLGSSIMGFIHYKISITLLIKRQTIMIPGIKDIDNPFEYMKYNGKMY